MKKNTKRSLLLSVLALILCCAMLAGTTLAWFTDSASSGVNKIQAGNLDIEVYHTNANVTTAEKIDGRTNLFTDKNGKSMNWEPGAVAYEIFTVNNEGSLALKYNLKLNITDCNAVQGTNKTLKEVLKVKVLEGDRVNPNITRENVANLGWSNTDDTLDFFQKDGHELMPKGTAPDSEKFQVVVYWQPGPNDNDWNVNNGKTTTDGKDHLFINFGINVTATQKDHENDSFGNDYDNIEVPEKDIKVIDGNTYYYYNNGVVALREVPYGNVGASFTVPNDVTILGQGDVYDGAVPVFSKSSPIQSITLPEGLVEIKARAITGVKTLTSINFPSTLKAIRAQALRLTGMDKLTVPANVAVIGEGAFRDMANLTTVTVEGNVAFDNNAFRSCPNLTSIYLLGDDVTFAGGQFATHSDDGNATGITIYVKNATVAARVYAAQTSAYGYEVKILGEAIDGSDAAAADVKKVANSDQLDDAIQAGAKAVVLAEGDYDLRFTNHTNFNLNGMTIKGLGDVNLAISSTEVWYGRVQGSNVTFENIHFTSSVGATGKATYNNCTFDDRTICASSNNEETTFNNCTINGCLHTSTEFSSGDVFVNKCEIAKAEYSGSMTMNFVDCQIDEIIIWNANTNLINCQVTTIDTSNVTNAKVTIK